LSYNYADSDFEFEDQHGGDGVGVTVDQETGATTETQLIGIIPPANLFGLSKHVSSAQLYWGSEKWNVEAFYKTRSGYYQQYTRDTQGRIRYTDDNETLDLKVRYKMFDNVDLTLEGKNILDEARIDYRAVEGNVLQALSYGPRYFFGVRAKF
jgi:iron complex outermembrane receptor protein